MANNNTGSCHHHHHHHHHDRSIHVQGNVGIVATGDGHRGDMVATFDHTQQQEKQQKEIAEELEEWTKGMVKTFAFKKVMEMLNKDITWITIKGSPGEGKTTVAKMALRELQKSGRQVCQARSPEDFNAAAKTYSRPVILLDDIFGDLEFDQANWLTWKPIFHKLLDGKEHSSHEEKTEKKLGKVTVLLVGRDYVLNSASVPMGRLFDYITKPLHVVDMSHSVERAYDEKKMIWEAIIGPSGIEVPLATINYIFQLEGGHGFPHVCRLFVTVHKKNPNTSVEKFFETPLHFLNETMKVFMENEMKLKLFKAMISRQGKVSERDLQENGHQVIKTAHELTGTYLRMEHGYFVFDHPSIYDSVAFNMCKYHTLFVIKNCELSFIHERIRVEPSRRSRSANTGLLMRISESFHKVLAERFASEIASRNLLTLSHQACTHEVFVKEMMSQLTSPDVHNIKLDTLLYLTDVNYNRHLGRFLCLIVSNRSPQLLKYVDNHPGIHLTQSDINTVLYGVCRYAASDVLAYLKQSRHTIDLNVKYDNTETPLIVASYTRDSQFVRQILSLRPCINARVRGNKTALHYLCINGLVSAVKEVIDMGADINVRDEIGWSPLHAACEGSNVDLVKILVQHGADTKGGDRENYTQTGMGNTPLIMNTHGYTPLHVAAGRGSTECVDILLKAGADANVLSTYGNIPLHKAAEKGSYKCVDLILKACADVNIQNKDGYTPLHEAAERGSKECVYMLLKAGADVNVQGTDGYTPLHKAAENVSKECVDMLLKAGAAVNVQNKDGYTPLHKSAERGSKECVDVLLKAGADLNVQSIADYTPLHKAAERGSKDCVDILLTSGADLNVQNKHGYTPLNIAAERGKNECVMILVKAGADVNVQNAGGYTALHKATGNGTKECVDMLLKAGADLNAQNNHGYTSLHKAVERGCKRRVEMLLMAGADVNVQGTDGCTPLHKAARNESKECVDMILKAGADVNVPSTDGCTPLHVATRRRSKECVDMLLKAGADVNRQNKNGYTPIHEAEECVDMLLKAGADVNVQGKDGYTPLHVATDRRSQKHVDTLLKAGADVNVQSTDGCTPLHNAALRKSKKCVDMLLKAGADVNVQATDGYTPLHKAAGQGSEECVDTLLKAGADVNVQSTDGSTPLHKAAKRRSKEFVDMLLKAGADVNVQTKVGLTPLHIAMNHSYPGLPDISLCETLFRHGARANIPDSEGNTPLHLLCCADSDTTLYKDSPPKPASFYESIFLTVIYLLVDHEADVNIHNNRGDPALHGWCETLVTNVKSKPRCEIS